MFDPTDPDGLPGGAFCGFHEWVVDGVVAGGDGSIAVEKVCRYCGALELTVY
jgi:hypothetical protein